MSDKILSTYALLAYLKETSVSAQTAITDLYIPLVKKAMSEYANENGLSEYKGRSLSEIQQKIRSIFELEIPLPILAKILKSISDEIGDENIFALYSDGAFIIKSYVFNDINTLVESERANIDLLKDDFKAYCEENGFKYNFEELEQFILAQQMDIFTDKRTDLLSIDYYVPKYIQERIADESIFRIMSNIYLGSIIASYLEQNITQKVTDTELLLDTNFFISLINLNTEDAYHTCNQLFVLCQQLGFRFTMLNSTVNQIKILLSNRINDFASRDFIGSVRAADVFNACIRNGIDKTGLERIKDNITRMINERGILVIQDAQILDLIDKAKKSAEYKELIQKRQNADSALNDIVAKMYVERKRGNDIREFVDVKCWFLHNSYSPYDYSYGHKVHERYLISANELLVLLWLSSPASGQKIKINDITKSGLASYITTYRRSKTPTRETLKIIKKRIDAVAADGLISEKDTFNLCIRMAEGHLTQTQVEESLVPETVTNEQFAAKLKQYSQAEELSKQQHKQKTAEQIDDLSKQVKNKDGEIQNLNKRIQSLEDKESQRQKDAYIEEQIGKLKRDTWINAIIVCIIIALWLVNELYKQILPTGWSIVVALGAMLATTFGTSLFRKASIKDYFCRKGLRERLAKQYDEMHKDK